MFSTIWANRRNRILLIGLSILVLLILISYLVWRANRDQGELSSPPAIQATVEVEDDPATAPTEVLTEQAPSDTSEPSSDAQAQVPAEQTRTDTPEPHSEVTITEVADPAKPEAATDTATLTDTHTDLSTVSPDTSEPSSDAQAQVPAEQTRTDTPEPHSEVTITEVVDPAKPEAATDTATLTDTHTDIPTASPDTPEPSSDAQAQVPAEQTRTDTPEPHSEVTITEVADPAKPEAATATDTATLTDTHTNTPTAPSTSTPEPHAIRGTVTISRVGSTLVADTSNLELPPDAPPVQDAIRLQWQQRSDVMPHWQDSKDGDSFRYHLPRGIATGTLFKVIVTYTDKLNRTSSIDSEIHVLSNFAPSIDSVTILVPENAESGMLLARLVADDYNEESLSFTLEEGNAEQFFGLDAQTGDLSLSRTGLDFETRNDYTLTVRVTDGVDSAFASVLIILEDVNEAPVAHAGIDMVAQEGDTISLDGSASVDVDAGDTLTWHWTTLTDLTLQQADTAQPYFVVPTDLVATGDTLDLTFTLATTDAQGLTDKDSVTLTVQKVDNGPVTGRATIQRTDTQLDLVLTDLADLDGVSHTTYQWQRRDHVDEPWSDIPDANTLQYAIPFGTVQTAQFQALVTHTDRQGYVSSLVSDKLITLGNVAPRFVQADYTFTLPENSAQHTPVGTADAADFNQDSLHYRITRGNFGQAFALDPNTGLLTVNQDSLDHEVRYRYRLILEVTDGLAFHIVPVVIHLRDVNEPPQAHAGDDRTAPEGVTITLDAQRTTDPDYGEDLTWQWSAPEGITLRHADTSSPTFDIPLALVPAPDEIRTLEFVLHVTDAQGLQDTDMVTVTVQRTDNGPANANVHVTRQQLRLTLHIEDLQDPDGRGAQPDTTYQWQHRTDPDSPWTDIPEAQEVEYLIPAGTAGTAQFQAVVTHIDQQGYRSLLTSRAPITMGNVPPIFRQAQYSFSVPENSLPSTVVGIVLATDFNHDRLHYTIADGNEDRMWHIDPDTGTLTVNQPSLDHESRASHQLTVAVTDSVATTSVPVTITITDANEVPQVRASVPPTVQEGDHVTLDGSASVDMDAGDTLTWRWTAPPGITLQQADTAQPYFVVPTNLITTGDTQDLTFTLDVTDAQGLTDTGTVTVTVQKVDNGPVTGTATIQRTDTQLDLVLTDLADPDGISQTTYQWQHRDHVDRPWSDIPDANALQYTMPFSTARTAQFQALVTHTDQQGYVSSLVSDKPITMGNVPPRFVQVDYTFTLPENSARHTPVGTADATDFNQDPLHYTITDGNENQTWHIEPSTGTLTVNQSSLDHESRASYQLTVAVTDSVVTASVPVIIVVTDINEAPRAQASAPSTVQEGDHVILDGSASADEDAGDTLAWHWTVPPGITLQQPATAQPYFVVPTDLVMTDDALDLTFTLETTDVQGLTDTDSVTVIVNRTNNGDTTGSVTVYRTGMELYLEVTDLADPDGVGTPPNSMIYHWRCRDDANSPWTEIHGATESRFTLLDGTAQAVQFQALVIHTDRQGYVSSLVSDNHITMGNVPPHFAQDGYTFTLPENSARHTPVGTADAADFNHDPLHYTITSGNEDRMWHINPDTGALTVNQPSLDHESRASYQLTVAVTDEVATAFVPVTITVTDVNEAPRARASAPPNVQEGDTIRLDGSASTDVDAGDTLAWHWTAPAGITLQEPATAQPYFVVPTNLVTTDDVLDLTFSLKITDAQGLTDTDSVTVTVRKVDNGPVTGSATIQRTDTRLDLVLTDLDDPDGFSTNTNHTTYQWQRRDQADSSWTDIPNANTRQYTIPFGTARTAQFQVLVTHTDQQGYLSTLPSVAPITMGNVPPRFVQADYTFTLPENSARRTPVGIADAADFNHDPLHYRITRGNFRQAFALDPDTGTLTVNRANLDHEGRYYYRLTLEVSDGRAVHTVPVTLHILDINEPPQSHAGNDRTVPEGVTVTLDAQRTTDPDHGDNLSWHWSAPEDIILRHADTATPTFDIPPALVPAPDEVRTLEFILRVIDAQGLQDTDMITVTVQRTDNGPATANVHVTRQQLRLTLHVEDLKDPDGRGTAPDNTTYQWQLRSHANRQWRAMAQATQTQFDIPPVLEPGSQFRAVATHTDHQGYATRLFSNVIDLAALGDTDRIPLHTAVPGQDMCVIPVFALGTLHITDNLHVVTAVEEQLGHNIPNLRLTLADRDKTIRVHFRDYFLATGGLARWGYPTSEVVVLEPNILTQYYERGVVSFRFTGKSEWLLRDLLWDYLGAGLWDWPDQDAEPHVLNPHEGEVLGPWGHKVSNYAVDGTWTGFADFFARYGGERSFGYPRTEARPDTADPDMVSGARAGLPASPGVIRQYFQAAVLEFDPTTGVIRILDLGNIVRDLVVPHHATLAPFTATSPLRVSRAYFPPLILNCSPRVQE